MTSRFLCWNWNASLLNSTWGYNFNWRNTGKQTACSNLSCNLVMEVGCQKSKWPSYTAKFKHEVIWCVEDKETAKPLQFLELMKATFNCGGNTRQRSAGVRRHKRNSLDPRKDDFLKLMMQSSHSFIRDARLDRLWVMIYFARRR